MSNINWNAFWSNLWFTFGIVFCILEIWNFFNLDTALVVAAFLSFLISYGITEQKGSANYTGQNRSDIVE